MTTLKNLDLGKKGIIEELLLKGTERRRMLDLGFVRGTTIETVQLSPSGDPAAYYIRGTVIALRSEDAQNIIIEQLI